MATKKQKRAAAEEKHRKFMENERQIGLAAQQRDRAHRAAGEERAEHNRVADKKRRQKMIRDALVPDEASMEQECI